MLNPQFYQELFLQFESPNNFADLNIKIIDKNQQYPLYLSFGGRKEFYIQVIQALYVSLAKVVFSKYADYPDLKIGQHVREKTGNKRLFQIVNQSGENYMLKEIKKRQKIDDHGGVTLTRNINNLIKDFIPATQTKHRNRTLEKVESYFQKEIEEFGFTPTTFTGRMVFIGVKEIWDELEHKDAIPSTYYPKPSSKSEQPNPICSIPSLSWSLVDFYADINTFNTSKKDKLPVKYLVICDKTVLAAQQLNKKQDENLIILSKDQDFEVKNYKSIHWYKSEIDLINNRSIKEPKITIINDTEVNRLVKEFDLCLKELQNFEEPIELQNYPFYLKLILNAITVEEWNKLAERLERDQSLEQNNGEYTLAEIGEHNPKIVLQDLLCYLKNNNPKVEVLKKRIYECRKDYVGILASNLDIDRLSIPNLKQVKYLALKQMEKEKCYPFQMLLLPNYNCKKYYKLLNLSCEIEMVLFAQEEKLYKYHKIWELDKLEQELKSKDREVLFGLKYKPLPKIVIEPSLSLHEVSDELDEISDIEYDELKQKGREKLIDERENETIFRIIYSNGKFQGIKGNETVLRQGEWVRVHLLNEGDEIQLYEDKILDDLLIELALKKEPEKAIKVQKDSKYWQGRLKILHQEVFFKNVNTLYLALKEKGLKVQQNTVERYLDNKVMFPMYYSDLKAIIDLANEQLNNKDESYPEIRRSKKWYSSTSIRLGREVKKEIERFINENKIGENLVLLGLSAEQLNNQITQQMPVLKIIQIIPENQ